MNVLADRLFRERYDAWRTMSEDDYHEAQERRFSKREEPEYPGDYFEEMLLAEED